MEYQLQLKPFQRQDGFKYKILQITDIALHANAVRPTSIGKKIREAIETHQPVRIYAPIVKRDNLDSKTITLDLLKNDPDFVKLIQEEEKKGYKILLQIPKGGLPILAGRDTSEFIDSVKGKRIHVCFTRRRGWVNI